MSPTHKKTKRKILKLLYVFVIRVTTNPFAAEVEASPPLLDSLCELECVASGDVARSGCGR